MQDLVIGIPFLGPDTNVVLPITSLRADGGTFVTSQSPDEILKMPVYKTGDLVSHFGTA